jgi:hypothetical protein
MGLLITSHCEVGVALIASSAATLRPLLIRLKMVFSRHGQSQESDQRCLNGSETGGRYPRHEHTDEINVELGESS